MKKSTALCLAIESHKYAKKSHCEYFYDEVFESKLSFDGTILVLISAFSFFSMIAAVICVRFEDKFCYL